jgi:hypothetical protein
LADAALNEANKKSEGAESAASTERLARPVEGIRNLVARLEADLKSGKTLDTRYMREVLDAYESLSRGEPVELALGESESKPEPKAAETLERRNPDGPKVKAIDPRIVQPRPYSSEGKEPIKALAGLGETKIPNAANGPRIPSAPEPSEPKIATVPNDPKAGSEPKGSRLYSNTVTELRYSRQRPFTEVSEYRTMQARPGAEEPTEPMKPSQLGIEAADDFEQMRQHPESDPVAQMYGLEFLSKMNGRDSVPSPKAEDDDGLIEDAEKFLFSDEYDDKQKGPSPSRAMPQPPFMGSPARGDDTV